MFLDARQLTKEFSSPTGVIRALNGISFSQRGGEFLAIQGPSGCGKTTLLLTIGGLLRPSGGNVMIDGQDPYVLPPDRRAAFRAQNVGFVFQQFHLVPYLNVVENILAPCLAGVGEGMEQRAWELLRQFQLEDRASHVPAKLSTGERQRTCIARAMLRNPGLILADEPTGNLDANSASIVLDCLRKFTNCGGAVTMVTHEETAAGYADTILRMNAGSIVCQGALKTGNGAASVQ